MNRVDSQYLDILSDILENGTHKETRSGKVRSVFCRTMRFDLKEGLPLLTTKRVYYKGIIHELLYFLGGKCTIDYLKDNNVNIWNGDCERWDKECGVFMGKLYPHQWRHWGAKTMNCDIDTQKVIISISDIEKNYDKVYDSKYGQYIILNKEPNGYVKIQFLKTGYSYSVRKKRAIDGEVKDPYYHSWYDMCCVGDIKHNSSQLTKKLYILWKGIVERCYNPNSVEYHNYGGRGVRMSNRWKCFEYFCEDVTKVKGYEQKIKNWSKYEIDKDGLGNGFLYSTSTCQFVTPLENSNISLDKKFEYTVKNLKTNNIHKFNNIYKFCIDNNIKYNKLYRDITLLNKKREWELISKEIADNKGIDQISLIIEKLKNNPDDRRIILSAWNVDDFDDMCLHPCHVMSFFYTRELSVQERASWVLEHHNMVVTSNDHAQYDTLGFHVPKRELSCSFSMRSNDFCCGNPFNIAQYAILTEMLAHVCNMTVGELVYIGNDVHVYENHVDLAMEQLKRRGSDTLPKLSFNRTVKDIDDFKFEDFIITNYNPDAAIKYPLSVG